MSDHDARLRSELQQVARIRRALIPDPVPQIPGLSVAASSETFTDLGGDAYDVFEVDGDADGRWCVFVADASGHGPAAAVAAAMVQATLRACATGSVRPAELLTDLNRHLCRKWIEGIFATAFVGLYEPSSRQLAYASAGHPPPLMPSFSRGPSVILDRGAGLPLGVDDEAVFDQATTRLEPGRTLVLYTDGISEARDRGGRAFGSTGIERSLRGCCGAPPCVTDRIRRSVTRHQGGQRPADDQTVMALRFDHPSVQPSTGPS